MIADGKRRWRRGTRPAEALKNPDHPYTMKLADGRTLFVEVPGRWVHYGRGGKAELLPDAVDFLDRVRALATSALDRPPSPGFVTALREGLGMTQAELGAVLGVDKLTVSRWERGTVRPSAESLKALDDVRQKAIRKGVTLPT